MFICAVIAYLILIFLYIKFKHSNNQVLRVIIKLILALIYFIVGLLGFLRGPFETYKLGFVIGLGFCVLGDMLLLKNYMVGGSFFTVGHLTFSYSLLSKIPDNLLKLETFIFSVLYTIALVIIFKKILVPKKDKYKPLITAYLSVISLSVCTSLITATYSSHYFFIGLILFFISDIFLLYDKFVKKNLKLNILNSIFYFTGIFLIAICLFGV